MAKPATLKPYRLAEAARILGIGRNACAEGVKRGDIPSLRIGKAILIPRYALDRLLAEGRPITPTSVSQQKSSSRELIR